MENTIASEFDAFSSNYTEDMKRIVPFYEPLLSAFVQNLPKNFQPKTILDLGSGNGNVTALLSQRFPSAQYTLVDASNEMLKICAERFKKLQLQTVQCYFSDFNFRRNSYDLVVAGFSLHHCDTSEKKKLFSKIYTSLNTMGIFACSDLMIDKNFPSHSDFLSKWKHFITTNYDINKWDWLLDHYDTFDRPDAHENQLQWLQEVGFNSTESVIYEHYWTHFKAFKN